MMTLFLTMTGAETTFQASENSSPSPARPRVRVIWGGGLGSTYQGYSPTEPGESQFSRPLSCPECGGSLDLRQKDKHSRDHLSATCPKCGFESDMEIASDGRITLS